MFIGIIVVLAGILFLLQNLGIITGSVWGILWPLLVIVIGLGILFGRRNRFWHHHRWDDQDKKD